MTESFSSVLIIASHMVSQRDRYECISRKCIRIYIKVKKEITYLQPQEDTRIYSRFYCDAKFRQKSTITSVYLSSPTKSVILA